MSTMENKKRFLINFAYIAVILFLVFFVFKFLLSYLMPFVIAVVVSMIIQRPARFLNRKLKVPKSICSVALVALLYILFVVICGSICYFLYQQVFGFFTDLPKHIPSINAFIDKVRDMMVSASNSLPDGMVTYFDKMPETIITNVTGSVTKSLSAFASSTVLSTPEFLISVIVTVVASCYFAADYDTIIKYVSDKFPDKLSKLARDVKSLTSQTMIKMLRGYLLLMLITFAELTVSLYALGIKYAIVIAAIISIIDVLPVLGTGTVVIPWGIIAIINGKIFLGVGLLIMYIIITIVRNFLEPKVIGKQVGLYPLITLVAMFGGLKLFGFFGMLLVPVAVILGINLYRTGHYKI